MVDRLSAIFMGLDLLLLLLFLLFKQMAEVSTPIKTQVFINNNNNNNDLFYFGSFDNNNHYL